MLKIRILLKQLPVMKIQHQQSLLNQKLKEKSKEFIPKYDEHISPKSTNGHFQIHFKKIHPYKLIHVKNMDRSILKTTTSKIKIKCPIHTSCCK